VMGNHNFYVPAQEYGFVEIAHLSLCHAILDLNMGWGLGAKQSRLAVS
jgi:D-sedoheptulose 7-phosphate isomerase